MFLYILEESLPFGGAFGPAGDRDECIESSHHLFWRLLKLSPDDSAIPFSTISLAAVDERYLGQIDQSKMNALRRLFRPNAKNMLPLVPFIQSIDTVYKKIRFFRASVVNASVINNVLEGIINVMFFFVLGIVLLLFLKIDPWPLLVSTTSLLVSVSFALGPSVSKYVEVKFRTECNCKTVGTSLVHSINFASPPLGSFLDCFSSVSFN